MSNTASTTAIDFGRALARGGMIEAARWLAIGFTIFLAITLGLHAAGIGWDNTDDRPRGLHSNMRLRVDYGTGCQYLESRSGSLTPRLSADGKQVCR